MAEYALIDDKCPTCKEPLLDVEVSSAVSRASKVPVDQWDFRQNWRNLLCGHQAELLIDDGDAFPPTIKLVSRP